MGYSKMVTDIKASYYLMNKHSVAEKTRQQSHNWILGIPDYQDTPLQWVNLVYIQIGHKMCSE